MTITNDAIFAAMRTFAVRILPDGVEVFQGQQNRTPQPAGTDYVMMTSGSRSFLSSPYHEYDRTAETNEIARSTQVGIQMDFYGPNSADYVQRFATLFRDTYATDAMTGTGVTALYCDDGSQMPLTNGERQYEARWMLQTAVQVNPVVSTPMQFADMVAATLVKAD